MCLYCEYYKNICFMITIFKILLVIVLMIAMALVLLIIGHMANPADSSTKEDKERLLRDVENRERVITSNSIFHQFFARPERHHGK